MSTRTKYPRTMHLPWSPGMTNDDRLMPSMKMLEQSNIVVTEKMDGENTTMYSDGLHARSIDGRAHVSRDWIKSFWAQRAYLVHSKYRVCGENLYAQHSIKYDQLKSYFYGFSVYRENVCLSWDDTIMYLNGLDIVPVPVLYRGKYNKTVLLDLAKQMDFSKQEGYVVRIEGEIQAANFSIAVGKYVRPNHVQTDTHWMHSELITNKLQKINTES